MTCLVLLHLLSVILFLFLTSKYKVDEAKHLSCSEEQKVCELEDKLGKICLFLR